jgi:hypothetical protein
MTCTAGRSCGGGGLEESRPGCDPRVNFLRSRDCRRSWSCSRAVHGRPPSGCVVRWSYCASPWPGGPPFFLAAVAYYCIGGFALYAIFTWRLDALLGTAVCAGIIALAHWWTERPERQAASAFVADRRCPGCSRPLVARRMSRPVLSEEPCPDHWLHRCECGELTLYKAGWIRTASLRSAPAPRSPRPGLDPVGGPCAVAGPTFARTGPDGSRQIRRSSATRRGTTMRSSQRVEPADGQSLGAEAQRAGLLEAFREAFTPGRDRRWTMWAESLDRAQAADGSGLHGPTGRRRDEPGWQRGFDGGNWRFPELVPGQVDLIDRDADRERLQ